MAIETLTKSSEQNIYLVGNPNTGKSVLFGILTGKYVTVSNYPGTTVDILKGHATLNGARHTVVDTPGANSLIPMSEDERVTRDILLDHPPETVLQVGDMKNLKRVLLITMQLAEMGLPLVLALNMSDEARLRGIQVDAELLSTQLGIPVIPTVAVERTGVDKLMEALKSRQIPEMQVTYSDSIELAVEQISAFLPKDCPSKRGVSLMILSGDESLADWLSKHVSEDGLREIEKINSETQAAHRLPLGQIISRTRAHAVNLMYDQVTQRTEGSEGPIASLIGRAAMHPFWGLPFLLLVLYGMWQFVGVFGAGTVVDLIEEGLFEEYINPAAISLFNLLPIPFIQELFVGEYGVITMALTYGIAIVLPIVFFFFIAFGVLEDSGYLPRLAVMVNNIFRAMGLNGKAVLPMVLGLGCDTMATLTTRILETKRERAIVTLLLALGVPCSAQLGVILALLTSFKALLIWGGVVFLVLVVVGYLAGKVMPGQGSDFIMEVPPIRLPKISNIFVKTLARTEWYLKEALPLFVLGTLVLFTLDKLTILQFLERAASPVVRVFLGLPEEATRAFIMGFLRRDYGGAGLKTMYDGGRLTEDQILVSLITITLFVPCIANFFVMGKERGWKMAIAMAMFIVPTAILVGGVVRMLISAGIL